MNRQTCVHTHSSITTTTSGTATVVSPIYIYIYTQIYIVGVKKRVRNGDLVVAASLAAAPLARDAPPPEAKVTRPKTAPPGGKKSLAKSYI